MILEVECAVAVMVMSYEYPQKKEVFGGIRCIVNGYSHSEATSKLQVPMQIVRMDTKSSETERQR